MTGESKEILVSTVKPTITQAAIANFPGSGRRPSRKELRKNPMSNRQQASPTNASRLQIPSPLVERLVRERRISRRDARPLKENCHLNCGRVACAFRAKHAEAFFMEN